MFQKCIRFTTRAIQNPKQLNGVNPKSWMVYFMENPNLQMNDDWGYPYFRTSPRLEFVLSSKLPRNCQSCNSKVHELACKKSLLLLWIYNPGNGNCVSNRINILIHRRVVFYCESGFFTVPSLLVYGSKHQPPSVVLLILFYKFIFGFQKPLRSSESF